MEAVREDAALAVGVNLWEGELTRRAVVDFSTMGYTTVETVLA